MSDATECENAIIIQADRDAGQALLEQLHAIMRAQGAEVADTTVKDDGCIVQTLARHRAAHGVPAGWKLVPEVPTDSMRRQGESAASFGFGKPYDDEAILRVWEWMLATTPEPPVEA